MAFLCVSVCVHKNRRNTQYAHRARIVHCIFGYVRKHHPAASFGTGPAHIVPNLERIRFRLAYRFHILVLYVVFFSLLLPFTFRLFLHGLCVNSGKTACYRTHALLCVSHFVRTMIYGLCMLSI